MGRANDPTEIRSLIPRDVNSVGTHNIARYPERFLTVSDDFGEGLTPIKNGHLQAILTIMLAGSGKNLEDLLLFGLQ